MAKHPVYSDGTINDFGIAHPQEVKDANAKQFTTLTKRVTEEVKRRQLQARERRSKYGGTK